MFEIRFDNQAADFLKKCDKTLFGRIKSKLSILVDNPIPHDSKPHDSKRVLGYEEPTFRILIQDVEVVDKKAKNLEWLEAYCYWIKNG